MILTFMVLYILTTVVRSIYPKTRAEYRGNFTGIAGQKVRLPCDITPSLKDDQVSLVLWYKDDSSSAIYSLDARQSSLADASHVASDSLAGRSYFSTVHRPAHLAIDYLLEEDEGHYRCRVDFKKSRTRNSLHHLKIIVPPTKPIIKDNKGEVLQGVIGPYIEGTNMTLVCEVDKGNPPPSLTWWKGSSLVDDSYTVMSNGIVRNQLTLGILQRRHLMVAYTCQASNSDFSFPVSSTVKLNMTLKPVSVKIIGKRHPLSANTPFDVICRVQGSVPKAHISWWKGSVKLMSSKEEIAENGNATFNYLTFTPSAGDNGKYLVCRAHNPSITRSTLEDNWKLEVHYLPQLNLRLGRTIDYSDIKEGSDVHFECDIRANPWINKMQWRFEKNPIYSNASTGIFALNQTLLLQRVQRGSIGHYTCVATNEEGTGESNRVYLRVQHLPVCKKNQKFIYAASLNAVVHVTCQLEADPTTDLTINWKTNITVPVQYFSRGTVSTATFVPGSADDITEMTCWGVNSMGVQKNPCTFLLIPDEGPASVVENCTISEQTDISLRVDCQPGYDGGLKQRFQLEVYKAGCEELYSKLQFFSPHFLIQDLTPDSSFLIIVSASNVKSQSRAVILEASTLPAPGKLTFKEAYEEIIYSPALVVAGSVLVVIAIVVAVVLKAVCRRRNTEERRKPEKRSGGKQAGHCNNHNDHKKQEETLIPKDKGYPLCTSGESAGEKLLDIKANAAEMNFSNGIISSATLPHAKNIYRQRDSFGARNNTIGAPRTTRYHKTSVNNHSLHTYNASPTGKAPLCKQELETDT